MTTITIKSYEAFYEAQVFALILKIQNEEFAMQTSIPEQPDLAKITATYQQGEGNFWIALHEEKVVGTIAVIRIGESQAALKKMYVDKNYRGKEFNVAKSFLDHLRTWCKNKNINEIYLGTTDYFLAAHKFYEKNGFSPINKENVPLTFPFTKYIAKFYLAKL